MGMTSTDALAVRHYADMAGLARLRMAAKQHETGSATEAAKQFEALFIQMMLKSMRDTVAEGGLFDGSHMRTYQEMFDQQISMDIARGQSLGIAPLIARQLGGRPPAPPQTSSIETRNVERTKANSQPPPGNAFERAAASGQGALHFDDPGEYVKAVWPHAERAARALGIAPEVLVAQSALETGWGERVPADPAGRSSHNLFGIKADAGWTGTSLHVPTLEFEEAAPVRRVAAFRAYESIAASFDDYVAFMRANPRYREALAQGGDAVRYARGLQRAGYATDPHYADKIIRIMQAVQSPVAGLKPHPQPPLS
jgi:flagellar protein FlgJ